MEKITIIGTGTMGHSIGLAIAWADLPVTIYGINDEEIKKAKQGITSKLEVLKNSNVIDQQMANQISQHIDFSKNLEKATKDATFIIEAAPENLKLKQELFKELEQYCAKETILASNSSSLPPTQIAKKVTYPERVLG